MIVQAYLLWIRLQLGFVIINELNEIKFLKILQILENLLWDGSDSYRNGFKFHLIINDKGEILNFTITQASTDDREPLKNQNFIKTLFGKLYADKGYISKELMLNLFSDGIHLITYIKNNIKNSLMTIRDKILLRKRPVIETVNDELKNMYQIEHSRHRSLGNFLTNLISGLIAYCFFPKKPSIKFEIEKTNQLVLF